MKVKQLILPGIAVAALYLMSQAKKSVGELSFKFRSAKYKGVDLSSGTNPKLIVDVKMAITNGGNLGGTINGAVISFGYKGRTVGELQLRDQVNVAGNATTDMSVTTALPVFSLFSSIKEAYGAFVMGRGISLNVKGVINTNYGTMNVDESLKVI